VNQYYYSPYTTMADLVRVVQLLESVQNPNNEQRNLAEKEINALSQLPIWPSGLLQIIGDARFSILVKLSASLELKRCTRKYWHYDSPSSGPPPYTEEVKAFGALQGGVPHPQPPTHLPSHTPPHPTPTQPHTPPSIPSARLLLCHCRAAQ